MVGLSDLPLEVLFSILDRLTTWRLEVLSMTCRDLKQVIEVYEQINRQSLKHKRARERVDLYNYARQWCKSGYVPPHYRGLGDNYFRYPILVLMNAFEEDPNFCLQEEQLSFKIQHFNPWPHPWIRRTLLQFLRFVPYTDLIDLYIGRGYLSVLNRAGLTICKQTGAPISMYDVDLDELTLRMRDIGQPLGTAREE